VSELIIQGLALELQPLVRELLRRGRLEGLDPFIPATGGSRSSAEQMRHYTQGRHFDDTGRWAYDDPEHHAGVVTLALPARSPHCHRAAVDVELLELGRVLTLGPELAPAERARQLVEYSRLGQIGEDLGLVWGGRWTAIHDYDHFELKTWRALPLVA
jgi:hypothetical protein